MRKNRFNWEDDAMDDDFVESKFQDLDSSPDTDSYYRESETTFPETNHPNQRYCSDSFSCGQSQQRLEKMIQDLENQIEELEDDVQDLQETALEKRQFLKMGEHLLKTMNFILIIIPIVVFAALAIGVKLYNGSSFWLNGAVILIGAASIAEYFSLPFLWKRLETRVQEIEDHLNIK